MAEQRRITHQRQLVSQALEDQAQFVSAQSLFSSLRASGAPVGLATVYRALQNLADDGAVDVIRTTSGESVYRRCSPVHHHHLVCRECGRTVEIVGAAVERWSAKVGAENGFADIEHDIHVTGTCAQCQKIAARTR